LAVAVSDKLQPLDGLTERPSRWRPGYLTPLANGNGLGSDMKWRLLHITSAACITLMVCCGAADADSHPTLYIGVLENIKSNESGPRYGAGAHVRVALFKDGDHWVAMNSNFGTLAELEHANDSYPARVDWTVVFDGKKIGSITSEARDKIRYYGDIGIQSIVTDAKRVPIIRIGSSDFDYQTGKPETRPLLLVSADNFRDPDGWKPTVLSATERAAGIGEFRKLVPTSERCSAPEQHPVTPVHYADNQVKTLKAYRSKDGTLLFGFQLHDLSENCGWFDDANFYDYWFVIEKGQKPRELGNQMQPMEAADLDNSGKSQWVFHTSRGDNEDGYTIYWDNFSKHAEFSWSYH
jgi:hypothetical protein